jgi:hypothetical protein
MKLRGMYYRARHPHRLASPPRDMFCWARGRWVCMGQRHREEVMLKRALEVQGIKHMSEAPE